MNFYILLVFIYTFLYAVCEDFQEESKPYDRAQTYMELNRELRKYICCARNMKCCKKRETTPLAVEVRAVLVRCPAVPCEEENFALRRLRKPAWVGRTGDLKEFQGFDEDEPAARSAITDCRKKLLLTMKLSSEKVHSNQSKYLVVDHAYDPVTKKKKKLLVPYVIKFKEDPPKQMYGMKFLHMVNSQVREEIFNKHMPNFTGCDTTSSKPTCGKIMYKGKVVPYSEGFCCSCDAIKNAKRQPESLSNYVGEIISYSDPAFLLDGIECPKYSKGADNNNAQAGKGNNFDYQSIIPKILANIEKQELCNQSKAIKKASGGLGAEHEQHTNALNKDNIKEGTSVSVSQGKIKKPRRTKRQVQGSGAQRRGGQNCADRFTPKGLDPETYHESAHCLHFSDLWYTVYHLEAPIIKHSIYFQIFEKHEDTEGHTFWRDIPLGKQIQVGTTKRQYTDKNNTVSIKYVSSPITLEPGNSAMDFKSALLLVPEITPNCNPAEHPEILAGPPEYLMVHRSQVSLDGGQCNVAGVGFEAFVRQPSRCSQPKGSCLLNQPHDLWQHDHLAEQLNKKGCFFLKYHGKLPENPITKNVRTNQQFLTFKYEESYSSTVEFEIRADFNTVVRRLASAVITEVYVDSTSPKKTKLTVKITNAGLVSSNFIAKLSDCPLEMPASFNNIESEPMLIPPQQQHIFHLKIKCILPVDRFHCSIEALNSKRELVALRRIRIQKFDRCICTWHCLCACAGSSDGLKCVPMSLHQYHAAGFQGALPVTTHLIHYTFIDEILAFVMYIGLFVVIILLTLGLCKALIGICCSPVIGILGLDVILDLPKPLRRYYEFEIRDRHVIYDRDGWPIHPDTNQRVRSIGRSTEFCMNIVFFFVYPLNVFILVLKKICCAPFTYKRKKYPPCYCETPQIEAKRKFRIPKKRGKTFSSLHSSTDNDSPGTSTKTCDCCREINCPLKARYRKNVNTSTDDET